MSSLQSIKYINELMEKHNITFKRSLGQNFLIDKNALERIILEAELIDEDIVLEVGPGIGALTQELAKCAKKVFAVEIDQRLIPVLDETLAGYNNVKIINEDILELDLKFLSSAKVKIVANLPYYITTPIIYHFLNSPLNIDKMVFLVQKEVAQRFVAEVGTKHYGTTSITLKAYAEVELSFIVKPVCFVPRPKVDSAVIKIIPRKNFSYDPDILQRLVKKAFMQRRKKIINSLSAKGDFSFTKDQWSQLLEKSCIEEIRRPDNIRVDEYVLLANYVNEASKACMWECN